MLRFTIRDLFWLTLVVASLLGWWSDRSSLYHQLSRVVHGAADEAAHWNVIAHELAKEMQRAGWTVDLERDEPPWAEPPPAVP